MKTAEFKLKYVINSQAGASTPTASNTVQIRLTLHGVMKISERGPGAKAKAIDCLGSFMPVISPRQILTGRDARWLGG